MALKICSLCSGSKGNATLVMSEKTAVLIDCGISPTKLKKELADFNKNNAFDVEKYLAHRLVMSEDTEFEMYEVTVTQEDVSVIEAEEGED